MPIQLERSLIQVSGKDDKNTFRVEFDLGDSGLAYLPGDALGIYPTNSTKVRSHCPCGSMRPNLMRAATHPHTAVR